MNIIKPEQLGQNLGTICWIAGDEPLLVNESADQFASHWRTQGAERFSFQIEKNQPVWDDVLQEAGGMSLFASLKLLDIRFAQLPSEEDKKQLARILPLADNTLAISIRTPAMNKKQTSAKWLQALPGVLMQIWPMDKAKFPNWLASRASAAGFQLDQSALSLLAERTEGNLLAAMQELEKLKLLCEPGQLTGEQLMELVANSSRYKPQDLLDAALQGNLDAAVKIQRDLITEGVAEPLLSWAIANDLRTLLMISSKGNNALPPYMRPHFARAKHFERAAARHSTSKVEQLLKLAGKLDRLAKGMDDGDFERATLTLLAKLAA
ncbi:DNA polymerase III subunit delta [Salinibius halmophilus]|uniref:DNA polymerase III subunit delta n=1 Tax=Salinibius halmophilus TaxID=1853216 RepID=UPI000E661809|nr:DNA polymerase III subunit delta [Salinibius halmophilus]